MLNDINKYQLNWKNLSLIELFWQKKKTNENEKLIIIKIVILIILKFNSWKIKMINTKPKQYEFNIEMIFVIFFSR